MAKSLALDYARAAKQSNLYVNLRERQNEEFSLKKLKEGIENAKYGHYASALDVYEQVLEVSPNLPEAYVARGSV